jgi:Protein of unknown function (DUF4240)
MDETRFWSIIESAWEDIDGQAGARQLLATGQLSEDSADELAESLEDFIPALQGLLDGLPADELLAFEHILEHKLHDIDRADIQKYTDGSDDGFLYARGFIIAAGKGYYNAVQTQPSIAMMDLECEDMCFVARIMYEEKFGEMPPSDVSIESCSNKAGWPDDTD